MCLYLEKLLSFANVFYDFIVINRRVFFHIILSGFFSSFLIVEPALFPGISPIWFFICELLVPVVIFNEDFYVCIHKGSWSVMVFSGFWLHWVSWKFVMGYQFLFIWYTSLMSHLGSGLFFLGKLYSVWNGMLHGLMYHLVVWPCLS